MSKDRNSHFRPPPTRGLPSAARIAAGGNQGRITARDRFNNTLVPGALVCYRPAADVVYQVESIAPVLDPRAQGGFVTVTLVAKVPLTLQANSPVLELLIVGMPPTADQQAELERAQAAAAGNGAGPSGIVVPPGFEVPQPKDDCQLDHFTLAAEARDKGISGATCPDCDTVLTAPATDTEAGQGDPDAEARAASDMPPKGPDDGEPQT